MMSSVALLVAAVLPVAVGAQSGTMAKGDKMDKMEMKDATYTGCIAAGTAAGTFMLTHVADDHMRKDAMKKDAMKNDAIKNDAMKKDTIAKATMAATTKVLTCAPLGPGQHLAPQESALATT